MVGGRRFEKAPGFGRRRGGPSKHGETLSVITLPALSMTQAWAAHNHFQTQAQKRAEGEPGRKAHVNPPSAQAVESYPAKLKSLNTIITSYTFHPPSSRESTERSAFGKNASMVSFTPQICTEHLPCPRHCGFKNKLKHRQDLCPLRVLVIPLPEAE